MMEQTMELAIERSVTVNAPVERAFEVFTRGIETWWPRGTHSIRAVRGEGVPQEIHLELREGGRFYERTDGVDLSWGNVLVYEPPTRIVLEWHVNPANPATEVEVTFTPERGGTRVDLVHRGWERFADPEGETRSGYGSDEGWTLVLGHFADAADR